MAFKSRVVEPVEEFPTAVWLCSEEDCIGWIRDKYCFDKLPTCPFCKSEMIQGTKMIPVLSDTMRNYK